MTSKLQWLLAVSWLHGALGILCFNCTSTHRERSNRCAGDFEPLGTSFNNSRVLLVNCTGEGSMCFVRSWAARSHFAWMVQRGCYQATKDDTLPRTMTIPTRSMTCRNERYPDAEYKLCFCQAHWCNSTTNHRVKNSLLTILIITLCLLINHT